MIIPKYIAQLAAKSFAEDLDTLAAKVNNSTSYKAMGDKL